MLKRNILLLCLLLVFSGCAAKSQFVYDHPVNKREISDVAMVAALLPIEDQRSDDKKIDIIYAEKPTISVQKIMSEELLDTGLFETVISIPKGEELEVVVAKGDSDLVIYSELQQMQWQVPDYDAMIAKVFVASFLTGGLGGLAYGATSTDVFGHLELHVRVVDRKGDKELLNKVYKGAYQENMAKLSCDTPKTKAMVIGKSLKMAMDEFKKDLNNALDKQAGLAAAL